MGYHSTLRVALTLLLLDAARADVLKVPLGLDALVPAPSDNPLTKDRVALGRKLFFDTRLSRDGSISCASCHLPEKAYRDGRASAAGIGGREGTRRTPALINLAWAKSYFWDGRAATLEEQVVQPIQNPKEMDLTLNEAAARTGIDSTSMARALASYVRTILSGNSPYDRYIAGDRGALDAEAQLGLKVFRGKGNCIACHLGPNLTDDQFHNTGSAWRDGKLTDNGRANGAFKTPTLREAALTGPYMHNGSLKTLEDVIDFYDKGGIANPHLDPEMRKLNLTGPEKKALVTFLHSLTGSIQEGW